MENRRSTPPEAQARLKQKAAEEAVGLIQSGMVLGLGTGSTVRFALEFIGDSIKRGKLRRVVGIPSSIQTEKMAREWSIPIVTLEERSEIDLTIDGADEVDPQLDLIKGGGGALMREKVLAQASRTNMIIVDESKLSSKLGTLWPVPVEVIPFAWPVEANYLRAQGAEVTLRKKRDGGPFVTDQGNFILDCRFGPILEPAELAYLLSQRAGIVEHGLFLRLASEVIVAGKDGIRHLRRTHDH